MLGMMAFEFKTPLVTLLFQNSVVVTRLRCCWVVLMLQMHVGGEGWRAE